jgi:hypothetical protein
MGIEQASKALMDMMREQDPHESSESGGRRSTSIEILMSISRGDSYAVGETMTRLDREIRRSVALNQWGSLGDQQVIDDLQNSLAVTDEVVIGYDDSFSSISELRRHVLSAPDLPEEVSVEGFVARDTLPSSFDERRAADRRRSKPTGLRPIPLSHGGTDLVAFEPGSGHILLEAYGETIALLTSLPVTALVNTLTLGGFIKSPALRLKKFMGQGHSGKDMLASASKSGGALEPMLGRPVQTIDFMDAMPPDAHLNKASFIRKVRRDGTVREEIWTAEFE